MASKTRVILLAVVLLSAGLAGCADTDDTGDGDTDTGDRDTGDRDTRETDEDQDRDTGDRDTQQDRTMFNRSFNDTIDEQDYQRNWTVPANESDANVTIEANISGDAVDDFEATLWDPQGDEVCTVEARGDTAGADGVGMGEENTCEERLETSGAHQLTVWGNATAGEAEYWLNVTVERPQQAAGGGQQTGGSDAPGAPGDAVPGARG